MIICLLSLILGSIKPAYAKEDKKKEKEAKAKAEKGSGNFVRWNKEKKDEAWLTYCSSGWDEVQGLVFSKSGSVAACSSKDAKFLDNYALFVREYLKKNSKKWIKSSDGTPTAEYAPIILCMMKVMENYRKSDYDSWLKKKQGKDVGDIVSESDICNIRLYVLFASIKDSEVSLQILYNSFVYFQNKYNKINKSNPCSIYKRNAALKAVIQSVMYSNFKRSAEKELKNSNEAGIKTKYCYIDEYSQYSESTAHKFYKANQIGKADHFKPKHDNFAKDVIKIYAAVKSNGVNLVTG